MSKSKTNRVNTLNEIVNQFTLTRIITAMEKKLYRNRQYRELEAKIAELEEQILSSLSDEQKEVLAKYRDLNVELTCIREEFVYRRGMIDAFRIEDIMLGAFE